MQVNIRQLLDRCGMAEPFYPGKRIVQKMPQTGEFKSHCVVYDWRHSELMRIEIKAGLTGKDVTVKELTKYPVSFQMPTYMEIDTSANLNKREESEGEDEGGEGRSGKGGGGGKRPSMKAFSQVVEGRIPDLGDIKKLVVMGKEIAQAAMQTVLDALTAQIKEMKITPVNILASISQVTKIAPGGRSPDEISPSLLKGAKPYKPKDMFGADPT